jgi:purine-nucleoside phosphorylase
MKVLENLEDEVSLSFTDVFGIAPTVEGHSGSLHLGKLDGRLICVMRGRFHVYEGHNWEIVTLATRTMVDWGVPELYVTNACGGMTPNLEVGDLMLLTGYRDHLGPRWRNEGMLGALHIPVINCENQVTAKLCKVAQKLASERKEFKPVKQGVYAAWHGPCYETLAEIEMLKALGANAVGMSTVPELETAKGTGTTAAGISVITNSWSKATIHGHKEVLAAAQAASDRLDQLLRAVIAAP